jgi:hypothetical protein
VDAPLEREGGERFGVVCSSADLHRYKKSRSGASNFSRNLDLGAGIIGGRFGGEILVTNFAHRAGEKETARGRKKLAIFSLLRVSTNACARFHLCMR